MKILKASLLALLVVVFIDGVSGQGGSVLSYYSDSTAAIDSVNRYVVDSVAADTLKVVVDSLQSEKLQLAEGEALYEKKCQKCHELHSPSEYDMSQWEEILPVMKNKAKLTKGEYKLVHAYVSANSKK